MTDVQVGVAHDNDHVQEEGTISLALAPDVVRKLQGLARLLSDHAVGKEDAIDLAAEAFFAGVTHVQEGLSRAAG